MDPVSGIGLAASVIQLVHFSLNTAKTCREIYRKGYMDDDETTASIAGHLAHLTTTFDQSLHAPGAQSVALSSEENEIVDLGRKCRKCANKLGQELRKLHAQPQGSALGAVRKTARSIWKRGTIFKLQAELESYQSILEASLLYRLR